MKTKPKTNNVKKSVEALTSKQVAALLNKEENLLNVLDTKEYNLRQKLVDACYMTSDNFSKVVNIKLINTLFKAKLDFEIKDAAYEALYKRYNALIDNEK
jgi:hypothetical protein